MKEPRNLARALVLLLSSVFLGGGYSHSIAHQSNNLHDSQRQLAPIDYPEARYVKIMQNTTDSQLSFFEVQAFSHGVNLAIGKFAEQSSTLVNDGGIPMLASNGVDGDFATFSHTDCDEPWWIVDLGELVPIENVTIINYYCDDESDMNGCLCQLSYAGVYLLDENESIVDSETAGDTCGQLESIHFVSTAMPSKAPTQTPSYEPTMSPSFSPTFEVTAPDNYVCLSYPMARYVKIESTTGDDIQMFDVEVISSGMNIALGKPADQSSTLVDDIARLATYAVDGDLTTYSHTDCDGPWWLVDLGELVPIEKVTIINRWCDSPSDEPGCLCHLSNATLSLLDESEMDVESQMIGDTCGVIELNYNFCEEVTEPPTESPTTMLPTLSPSFSPTLEVTAPDNLVCLSHPGARYIKIEQTTVEQLSMFEVEVISSGMNVALGKPADQSSTLVDDIARLASYAVDGDLTTYSHTDCDGPWWLVDLGEVMPIERVVVLNRWCEDEYDEPGCLCHLSNATISLLSEEEVVIDSVSIGGTCGVEEVSFAFCNEVPPTASPDCAPTESPTESPTEIPTESPTQSPTESPTDSPTESPTESPSQLPSVFPTLLPTLSPSYSPTLEVTAPDNLVCLSYPEARYVKIMQSTTDEQVELVEVHVISGGLNVALEKLADQSSTFVDDNSIPWIAPYAIDGNMTTCSRTDCDDPWWIVDLGCLMPIESIIIFNSCCDNECDDCQCKLSNATLSLLGEEEELVHSQVIGDTCDVDELVYNFCEEDPTPPPSNPPSVSPSEMLTSSPTLSPSYSPTLEVTAPDNLVCLSYPEARYVKIMQSTTDEQVELVEVHVISGGLNVALEKLADQSSTFVDDNSIPWIAPYAIDGNMTTCSRTDCDDPWWIVDLGCLMPIESIIIFNSCCDNECDDCQCKLSNATLSLLGEEEELVHSQVIGDTCDVDELVYNFCEEDPTPPPSNPPSVSPSEMLTSSPSKSPSLTPTESPSLSPSNAPSAKPTTSSPSLSPTSSPTISPSYSPTYEFIPDLFSCMSYPMARYVKLMQGSTEEQLSMIEVEVYSSGMNVALGKPASQKDTLTDEYLVARLASFAVDGDMTTYSHTDCDEPWWVVDLGELVPIEKVTIVNRWCDDPSDAPGCLCHLSQANLLLLDEAEAVVETELIGDTCGVDMLSFEFCADGSSSVPSTAPSSVPR